MEHENRTMEGVSEEIQNKFEEVLDMEERLTEVASELFVANDGFVSSACGSQKKSKAVCEMRRLTRRCMSRASCTTWKRKWTRTRRCRVSFAVRRALRLDGKNPQVSCDRQCWKDGIQYLDIASELGEENGEVYTMSHWDGFCNLQARREEGADGKQQAVDTCCP